MPPKGYRNISIKEDIFQLLELIRIRHGLRSIAETVEKLAKGEIRA